MLPCVGCVGVVLGGRCWHSPFPLAMACCDSRPGFCCLKSPSVVYLPSFRHPPLGHKFGVDLRGHADHISLVLDTWKSKNMPMVDVRQLAWVPPCNVGCCLGCTSITMEVA